MGDLFNVIKITPIGIVSADKLFNIENMGKTVDNLDFKVVGIIDNLPNTSYGLLSISTINNALYDSSELQFDSISVKGDKNQLNEIKRYLNDFYPQYVVLESGNVLNDLRNLFFYMALFFVSIGTFIMTITTSKSISERTREIGVLKAVGWSNPRVVSLIVIEALVQLIITWIIVLIVVGMLILSSTAEFDTLNLIKNNSTIVVSILLHSFAVSLLMPLLGCLIPLVRVVRLKPTEALKYE